MALNIQRILTGIQIIGVGSSNISQAGEIEYLSSINKLQIHNGTSISPFVTEDHQATINNKLLIDATVLFANQSDPTKRVQFDLSGVPTGTTLVFAIPPAGGTVVTENGTQTLSNKSLVDNSTFVIDNGDATKRFKFEASGITTATTRTLTIQDQDTVLVGRDTTDNLSNKSLIDSSTWIIDEGDNTKKLQFQVSGITTATTRTLTVPDANTTIVGTDVAQVLSNKTLDDATTLIQDNSDNTKKFRFEASGISTSTTRVLTVPDATDTLVVAALAQTLTNKTFTDSTTFFQDEGDNTKKLQFQLSGITTSTTRTLTVPDANTTIVGTDTTQIITNKDIDGGTAANNHRLTLPKDTFANLQALTRKEGTIWYATDQVKPYFDTGSTLLPIGSGSGSGGVNDISNPDFETDANGWNTYADAAGVAPVDGTGGSPNVTFARTTSSPLRGNGSGLLTKDAANRQGQGVSTDFTIAREDVAKVHTITVNYEPSANFVAGSDSVMSDVTVWIYDVTNAQLIQPVPHKLLGGSVGAPWRYIGTFQTNHNSTSYRLILHVSTTNANAWTMKIDDIVVTPTATFIAPPVTDWQSYTPTFTGFGTTSNSEFSWRRVGDSVQIKGKVTCGTPTAVEARISLPAGLTSSDTSKIPSIQLAGELIRETAGSVPFFALIEPSVTYVTFSQASASSGLSKINGDNISSPGDDISITATVPVLGWSSGVLMSNESDPRLISAAYSITGGNTTPGSGNPLDFNTKVFDTHNAVTTGASWKFTAPQAGQYFLAFSHNGNVTGTMFLYKNGVSFQILATVISGGSGSSGSILIDLQAEDYIDIRDNCGATYNSGQISIFKVPATPFIAQTDRMTARMSRGTNQTIPTSSPTLVTWDTLDYDSHGATDIATGKFTAPIAGYYKVHAKIRQDGASRSATQVNWIALYKNGSEYSELALHVIEASGGQPIDLNGSDTIYLNAQEYIQIYLYLEIVGSNTITANAQANYFSVELVK